jgi:hypothetical protein
MEQIAVILLFLTMISAVVKIGFFPKIRHVVLFATGCGVMVFAVYPTAIEQNSMLLNSVLSRRGVLLNFALLLTAENLIFIWGNIFRLRQQYGECTKSPPWLRRFAVWTAFFPGVFFFWSLFFFEVQMFLTGWDIGFSVLAAMLATGTSLTVLAGALLLRKLFPEYELRMEICYFLYFAQIILAAVIAAGASPAGVYSYRSLPVDWTSAAGVAALITAGSVFGYLWHKNATRRKERTLYPKR